MVLRSWKIEDTVGQTRKETNMSTREGGGKREGKKEGKTGRKHSKMKRKACLHSFLFILLSTRLREHFWFLF